MLLKSWYFLSTIDRFDQSERSELSKHQPNSITTQVTFHRTKIVGKCRNRKNAIFWVIFQHCELASLALLEAFYCSIVTWKFLPFLCWDVERSKRMDGDADAPEVEDIHLSSFIHEWYTLYSTVQFARREKRSLASEGSDPRPPSLLLHLEGCLVFLACKQK